MFEWLARLSYRSARRKDSPLIHEGEFIYTLPYEPGNRIRILQGYGGAYSHQDESHFSLDFEMPERTAICAARGGVIYQVIDHFSEGGTHPSFKPKANAIYVLHTDDTIAAYAHLSGGGSLVRAGDVVQVGQTIGYSGNTGWSSTPHLHFHVADAFFHKRLPTMFHTVENRATTLEPDRTYTTPSEQFRGNDVPAHRASSSTCYNNDRNAFAFSPELFELGETLAIELSSAGFEPNSDYARIDAMHDVHGLEVCGIRHPQVALEITRLMLRQFPGWNAGWLHAPDSRSPEQWVASIQRDRDVTPEYWETD